MEFQRKDLSNDELIHLYKNLLWPRLIEEKMLVLLRQGRVSKWFSGIGQEAISVGTALALQPDEWMMPLFGPDQPKPIRFYWMMERVNRLHAMNVELDDASAAAWVLFLGVYRYVPTRWIPWPTAVVAATFGRAGVDFWRAAELAGDEHGRRFQQALLLQAVEQGR